MKFSLIVPESWLSLKEILAIFLELKKKSSFLNNQTHKLQTF